MVVSHCNVWLLKGNSTDPGNAAEALSQPAAGVSSLRVLAGQNGGLPWMFLNTTRKPPNIALDDDLSCQSLFKRLHLLGKMSNHWFECTLLPYQNFSDKSTSKKIFGCHVRFPEATTFTFQHVHAYTGWWFQTFFIFHNIWDNPSRWLIFFKMVKTTNQETIGYWGTKISDIYSHFCGLWLKDWLIYHIYHGVGRVGFAGGTITRHCDGNSNLPWRVFWHMLSKFVGWTSPVTSTDFWVHGISPSVWDTW